MCEQAEQVQTLALRFEQNLWFTLNQDVRLTFEGKSLQFASKVADRDEKTLLEVRTSQFDGLLPALKHRLSGQFTDTYWIAAKDMSRLPADTNLKPGRYNAQILCFLGQLGPVLQLWLLRRQSDSSAHKVVGDFRIPLSLCLRDVIGQASLNPVLEATPESDCVYSLEAGIIHIGSRVDKGHYYTVVRNQDGRYVKRRRLLT